MGPGTLVGERFELEVLAGHGGMSCVYRAHDRLTKRKVALKLSRAEDGPARERFAREAAILAELRHPGIVRYVAHGVADDCRYLAMEWLEGETLDRFLAARGTLELSDVLKLAHRIADALASAHARGIVHRDLKPSNLLLVQGRVERVTVLDFGIAFDTETYQRVTRTGLVVGTPAYIAPERARSGNAVSAAADVFSLGCVLYECLTGQLAFPGWDFMEVLAKIMFEPPPRAGLSRPDIPAGLDDLLVRMLARDPNERPGNGAELVRALASVQPPKSQLCAGRTPRVTSLPSREQRSFCVVMIQTSDFHRRSSAAGIPAENDELYPIAARHGGNLDLTHRGMETITFERDMSATDLASEAARCAIELRRRLPHSLLAIATGRGMVNGASRIGEVIDRARNLVGGQATLASEQELESDCQARPSIVLDAVTAGLLDREFEIVSDPWGVPNLVREQEQPDAMRLLLGKRTPCVGREHELSTLEAAFERCSEEAAACVVLVTGGPGIGKSRLRHEFTRRLRQRAEHVQLWQARGDPTRAGSPLGLLAQALRGALGVIEGEARSVAAQQLSAAVSSRLEPADRQRVTEFLGELIGIRVADEDGSVQLRSARRDARLLGDQMARAWEDWLEASCRLGPVVLVLEDLHWGDLPTLKFVNAALRSLASSRFFVLALAQPAVFDLFPDLWKDRSLLNISLGPLRKRPCEYLVRSVLGETPSTVTVERIIERSAGNAFYLEELIRAAADPIPEELPGTVLAMVHARMSRLPCEARYALRAASIFGEVFWLGGLAALFGPRQDQSIVQLLNELVEDEWICRHRETSLAAEQEYGFQHSLVREAAYASLTEDDRRVGHRLAAEWLERAGDRNAASLAEHFERADDAGQAVRWFEVAARQALEGNDLHATLTLAERAVTSGAAGETLGRLQLLQAEAHNWRGEYDFAARCGLAAMAELSASDADRGAWSHAVHQTSWASVALGRADEVERLSDALFQRARDEEDERFVVAMAVAVSHLSVIGRAAAASHILDWLRLHAPNVTERDPAVSGVVNSAYACAASANLSPAAALRLHEAAAADFERAGHQRWLCVELGSLGSERTRLGDYARAEEDTRRALELARRLDITLTFARSNLGQMLAQTGRLQLAKQELEASLVEFDAQQDVRGASVTRAWLARVFILLGDPAQGEAEARAASSVDSLPGVRAYALAVWASALAAQQRLSEAAALARQAFELTRALDALEEGDSFVRLVHAEALRATAHDGEACQVLRHARERIMSAARQIDEDALRASFLYRVRENARIWELAAECAA